MKANPVAHVVSSAARLRWGVIPRSLVGIGVLTAASLGAHPAFADNPIVQHVYAADPAPMVHGDTVYLCTSHDEDVTVNNFFTMNDWLIFSSKDMVNWTDHGSPLSFRSFSWATGQAWAPHCVARGGKFYMYVPVAPNAIGVAVADSPTGPYSDPLNRPLVKGSHQYIDPTVFVDSDGQAYLYFGNPKLWYVRLNADMISYSGAITEVPQTTAGFGTRTGNPERPTLYEEGPWFYRRGNLYTMMYAASGIPEDIAYSTAPGPTGPWTYRGIIMKNAAGHAFTNHAGVVDFKGRSFFFYHTQELPGGGGFKRSAAVEEFTYNADGSFPEIRKTSAGVTKPVTPLVPYSRVEGETMAWGSGVEVENKSGGGRNLSHLENGDHIKVESVDFSTGANSFQATVASAAAGGNIELHLDSVNGPLIGTCAVPPTGGWQEWKSVSTDVRGATSIHDLYLVFRGGGGFLFNLDAYQFTRVGSPPDGTGGTGATTGGTSGTAGGTSGANGGTSGGTSGAAGANGGAPAAAGGTAAGGTAAATGGADSASGGATTAPGQSVAGTGTGGTGDLGRTDDAEPAGCSCATGPRPSPFPWSLALGLLGLLASGRLKVRSWSTNVNRS